jgi:anti-sigma factor RsiW
MNPGKLFDYLDGKLSASERAEVEAQLISDPQLRRELSVARQIHSDIRETAETLETFRASSETARGAVLGRRIAVIFAALVFLNVLFGIYAIGFMGKKRKVSAPNDQGQQQLNHALQQAAAAALPTPNLEVDEIKVTSARAEKDAVAAKVIAAAAECGGSAAKNLNDENGLLVFAEVPASQENNFREKLTALGAAPSKSDATGSKNKIIQVRIVENVGH